MYVCVRGVLLATISPTGLGGVPYAMAQINCDIVLKFMQTLTFQPHF